MINHGHKCRHCDGKMSAPKPITDGPHKGKARIFCTNCGHIEHLAYVSTQQAQPLAPASRQMPVDPSGAPSMVFRDGCWEIS